MSSHLPTDPEQIRTRLMVVAESLDKAVAEVDRILRILKEDSPNVTVEITHSIEVDEPRNSGRTDVH